jgi:acetyltransferase-like isoleucine patch superfamily enzyme
MAALAKTLIKAGCKVTIACEPRIAYFFQEGGDIYIEDNTQRIKKIFSGCLGNILMQIDVYCGSSHADLTKAEIQRKLAVVQLLEMLQPDHVLIWSGNFHYQRGTRDALDVSGYSNRTLYAEVAWFPQKEFIYIDRQGVNAFSSLSYQNYPTLLPQQKVRLDLWRDRYKVQKLGLAPHPQIEKRIFVPLQIDTDTSIKISSPFITMAEFVKFLEFWIPDDYEVIFKLHPKATYAYVPTSRRSNFRFVASGTLEQWLVTSDTVIGINSTVLLDAAILGKRVVAFGGGIFSGTGALIEATVDSKATEILKLNVNYSTRDSFLYHLIFERQISMEELSNENIEHLLVRHPFNQILPIGASGKDVLALNAKEGKSMIRVGKSKVARTACLDVEKGGSISIGDDCEIRHHAVLEVSGRYNGTIEIGNHSVIGVGNWLQGSGSIKIGNDVIIGPYVAIVSTNHSYEDVGTPVAQQPLKTGEVVIEDDVWIGAHCTIALNVRIGAHSIIGAHSFVNKDVPPFSVVVGSPAKVIKSRK